MFFDECDFWEPFEMTLDDQREINLSIKVSEPNYLLNQTKIVPYKQMVNIKISVLIQNQWEDTTDDTSWICVFEGSSWLRGHRHLDLEASSKLVGSIPWHASNFLTVDC